MQLKSSVAHTSAARRFAALSAAAIAIATMAMTGTAQARAGADWVGPGYPNHYWAVWCVQHISNLTPDGYHYVQEDGQFGPDTEGAIEAFQSWDGLPADGIVGPQTGTELLSATNGMPGTDCQYWLPTSY